MTSDGKHSQWSEFIADFKKKVSLKQRFNDQCRCRLLNVLSGDAKRSVESIGKSKVFDVAA